MSLHRNVQLANGCWLGNSYATDPFVANLAMVWKAATYLDSGPSLNKLNKLKDNL